MMLYANVCHGFFQIASLCFVARATQREFPGGRNMGPATGTHRMFPAPANDWFTKNTILGIYIYIYMIFSCPKNQDHLLDYHIDPYTIVTEYHKLSELPQVWTIIPNAPDDSSRIDLDLANGGHSPSLEVCPLC